MVYGNFQLVLPCVYGFIRLSIETLLFISALTSVLTTFLATDLRNFSIQGRREFRYFCTNQSIVNFKETF